MKFLVVSYYYLLTATLQRLQFAVVSHVFIADSSKLYCPVIVSVRNSKVKVKMTFSSAHLSPASLSSLKELEIMRCFHVLDITHLTLKYPFYTKDQWSVTNFWDV